MFLHPQTCNEYALTRTECKTAPNHHGFVIHAASEDDVCGRLHESWEAAHLKVSATEVARAAQAEGLHGPGIAERIREPAAGAAA